MMYIIYRTRKEVYISTTKGKTIMKRAFEVIKALGMFIAFGIAFDVVFLLVLYTLTFHLKHY